MSFLNTLSISGSGMTAQRLRLDVTANNIANIETTRTEDGGPYRRKMVILEAKEPSFQKVFENTLHEQQVYTEGKGVRVSAVIEDETELKPVYDPEHPDADAEGYVMMPNIDLVKETADAMAATQAYQANITAFNATKLMAQKALEIGR
ncbi:flagellar basal body rod protein FlgC [Mediterraneibacter sp. NSJ-55]|uniref:Flagellar basal-body rod protein FlgC n=1 Tax=Mediterraneibacter hominis TaxID=2763054 RepID=A0A923LIC8_9FIRM|nr:flagellar basal body rod protein FlgC [Mediterraneibacter hominis]MBC5689347.1 flagellar basal body rod protein FlgC [Mediterraneibacter hominis]